MEDGKEKGGNPGVFVFHSTLFLPGREYSTRLGRIRISLNALFPKINKKK